MKPPGAVKSRALSIMVIVACLALGTLTVVRHSGDMWPWYAGVFYGVAVINLAAELLLSWRASKLRRLSEQKKTHQPPADNSDHGSAVG